MRISLERYALVVLTMLVLVGCRSSESSLQAPSWSMSKLNPFSKDSDDAAYPPKPSGLAAPSFDSPSGAGYADASSSVPGQGGYASVAPSYEPAASNQPGTPYSYPPASTSPAMTPQRGHYDTGSGSGLADRSGSVPSYASPGSPSSPSSDYNVAAANSQYGPSAPAPR